MRLFGIPEDRVHVLIHRQSIVHSMVEWADRTVYAELGRPDMRDCIRYAAFAPRIPAADLEPLDFAALGSLTFQEPDLERFPCLGLAFDAIGRGGNVPAALNAANEAAVAAFLEDRIGFYDISGIVSDCIDGVDFVAEPSPEDIFTTNDVVLRRADELIRRWLHS